MADMAIKLILSCAVLSSVGSAADQGCQGDHCPAAVNSLLQAGHKQPLTQMDQADETADDAEAALAQEKQEGANLGDGEEVGEGEIADDTEEEEEPAALAQMGTPSGYTAHTGLECKASNGGGSSVGKKTGVAIIGKGSEADAAAECEKFGDGCQGFSYGNGRFFLKKGFDMCKCAKVAAYTAYTKTSEKVEACKTATPRPTPRPASAVPGQCTFSAGVWGCDSRGVVPGFKSVGKGMCRCSSSGKNEHGGWSGAGLNVWMGQNYDSAQCEAQCRTRSWCEAFNWADSASPDWPPRCKLYKKKGVKSDDMRKVKGNSGPWRTGTQGPWTSQNLGDGCEIDVVQDDFTFCYVRT